MNAWGEFRNERDVLTELLSEECLETPELPRHLFTLGKFQCVILYKALLLWYIPCENADSCL
jgi:hypothetical protein